ncbi:MAG: DMT family transporter [Actinomycetota bacterium]|nr:DMT family transporter [Actinomycetota bacterium]
MLAYSLALAAAACWGVADFLGGVTAKKHPVLAVAVLSQVAGATAMAILIGVAGISMPPLRYLIFGVAGGVAGSVGLTALYAGLAYSRMGVVAPLAATSVVVPVAVGLGSGEGLSILEATGLFLAFAGVIFVSRAADASSAGGRSGVGLGIMAALGIGTLLVALERASTGDAYWAVFTFRSTSAGLLVLAIIGLRLFNRVPKIQPSGALAPSVAIGLIDTAANLLYSVSTQYGRLSIVAMLGSLYPVLTILLARRLLGETMSRSQTAGVCGTVVGLVMLSSGAV